MHRIVLQGKDSRAAALKTNPSKTFFSVQFSLGAGKLTTVFLRAAAKREKGKKNKKICKFAMYAKK